MCLYFVVVSVVVDVQGILVVMVWVAVVVEQAGVRREEQAAARMAGE